MIKLFSCWNILFIVEPGHIEEKNHVAFYGVLPSMMHENCCFDKELCLLSLRGSAQFGSALSVRRCARELSTPHIAEWVAWSNYVDINWGSRLMGAISEPEAIILLALICAGFRALTPIWPLVCAFAAGACQAALPYRPVCRIILLFLSCCWWLLILILS